MPETMTRVLVTSLRVRARDDITIQLAQVTRAKKMYI